MWHFNIRGDDYFMNKTRKIVSIGILIAFEIILTRFFSFQTSTLRISLGFLPIALSAIMFGPLTAGVTAALSDIIGMLIFPQGMYFPGFTFSAFIGGIIYGLFLYKKKCSFTNVFISVLLVIMICDLGLNTLWFLIITGNFAMSIFIPRLIKSIIMFPVQAISIYMVWEHLGSLGLNIYYK